MAIGLDDALAGWLLEAAGNAGLRTLRDDPTMEALRLLIEAAVDGAIATVAKDLDSEQSEHLRLVLREHDVQISGVTVSSITELRAAMRAWTAALDRPEFEEPGYLATLGIDAERLGDALADRITAGIRKQGALGPLRPLAEWLWRKELSIDVGRIREDLSQLRNVVEPPQPYDGGLPGGTPDFTGRQQVLDELAERVEAHDPTGVVVAIHAVDGMAGVGKTELALRLAHQHRQRYPDGQYFIKLHGFTEGITPISPVAALEELLRQAGLQRQAVPPDLAGRQARWQGLMASRQALVLLDNAFDVDQVRPLLPGAAGCFVLITSRSALRGLPSARTLRLDVLSQPEAVELFTRVADSSRPLDRRAVATVVELVGRLPVAVRAVASQVDASYSESELADDLAQAKDRISLVRATGPLGSEVSAAFETSLRRLDTLRQRAFRILGVHPGPVIGVPQYAALAELPLPEASSTLRALARRNLITPSVDRIGHRRYQLHDLLRDYARQQARAHLGEEERLAAFTRLTTWYASAGTFVEYLLDPAGAVAAVEPAVEGLELSGPGQGQAWVASEQDNLLAFAEQADGKAAADVCRAYAHRLYRLDHYASARKLYQLTARIYQEIGDRAGEASTLVGLSRVARNTRDYQAGGGHLRAARDLYQQTGDQAGEAAALVDLGRDAFPTGDYMAAEEHFQSALEIVRQTGHRGIEADALVGLGAVARLRGDYPAANEHLQAARDLCRHTGNREGEAAALIGLGAEACATRHYPAAGEHFRAALEVFRHTGNRASEGAALVGLGTVARLCGDYPAASEHLRAARDIFQQTGNRRGEVEVLVGLGNLAWVTGDYPAAGESFRVARDMFRQMGNRRGEAEALVGIGRTFMATGRRDDACELLREALGIYTQVDGTLAESLRAELGRLCPE